MLRIVSVLGVGIVSLCLFAGRTSADEKPGQAASEGKVSVASNFRTSELIGMPVRNRTGKDLGKIHDLVVELNSGDIRYAALSFGGFAGVGDKLFAVPWQAMSFKFGEQDRFFVFDLTPEKLEKAPGFDQKNWPDVANPGWAASIDKYYGVTRTAPPDKVSDKVTVERAQAPIIYDHVFRASTIDGMKVRNEQGVALGEVADLVVDIKSGKVKYAALSHGGFAGIGNKLFAVPMAAFALKHAANEPYLVLNISPERLKEAPGFDKNDWPNTADPNWASKIDEFYPVGSERRSGTR